MSHWFDDNKLVVNPKKCTCIILPKNYPFSISDSSGMRTIKTLYDLSSDWLLVKWSVLIGREQISRD